MSIDYFKEFPIPKIKLPKRLMQLLDTVGDSLPSDIAIASHYSAANDDKGEGQEYLSMLMLPIPSNKIDGLGRIDYQCHSPVNPPNCMTDEKGCSQGYVPSVEGHDYFVAAHGNGSFYCYHLAEKVWLTLGLTPRCEGGDQQRIAYDDLKRPEFGIVSGEVSNEYYYEPKRNIAWKMSFEYFNKYLWMHGSHAVRVFYYEKQVPDCPEIRSLLGPDIIPEGGWYMLDIREDGEQLLIQCWGTVVVASPQKPTVMTFSDLIWPGDSEPYDRNTRRSGEYTYIKDTFLEKYQQNGIYHSSPHVNDASVNEGRFSGCSPSYKGEWGFRRLRRVGRNHIEVDLWDLYEGVPAREVLYLYSFVVSQPDADNIDQEQDNIVSRTYKLLTQMRVLSNNLEILRKSDETSSSNTEFVGLDFHDIAAEGWGVDEKLLRLSQVAPLDMSQQDFLDRCKVLHELLQKIRSGPLKKILLQAGCPKAKVSKLRSIKLLQGLLNIVQQLNEDGEELSAFTSGDEPIEWERENKDMTALFINNELRIMDAHVSGSSLRETLEKLGFDTAALNEGYGLALDCVFDGVIASFAKLNSELGQLINRS